MQNFKYTIKDKVGFHARPAGRLARMTKDFPGTEISIRKGDKTVKASQLMKLMGLGVKCGDEIEIIIEGGDETAAKEAMQAFFEANL